MSKSRNEKLQQRQHVLKSSTQIVVLGLSKEVKKLIRQCHITCCAHSALIKCLLAIRHRI